MIRPFLSTRSAADRMLHDVDAAGHAFIDTRDSAALPGEYNTRQRFSSFPPRYPAYERLMHHAQLASG
ncbi:hypothetical protein WS54_00900 [Burkholderia sp. NRF60-BP8]|nr:hypothetical protein WS54_00900 [Burkholderia sp. NRF60-BP8]KVA04087.1 hypothetical protein WS54_03080 [Burkholderia sp. NRF60-BP8]